MNDARMPALLVSHHRPGFYLRVLREGAVQAGDEIVQLAGLMSGAVGYSPDPVDEPATGSALICCSRPRGDLVLDL